MERRKNAKKSFEMISKMAVKSAKRTANTACLFYQYQPKTPEKIKKLRKF